MIRGILAVASAVAIGGASALPPDGEWVIDCVGEADIVGTTSPEQAHLQALNRARAAAVMRLLGETIESRFRLTQHRRGEDVQTLSEREILALSVGMILDERIATESIRAIDVSPGHSPIVRLWLKGDFKVAGVAQADPRFNLSLAVNPETVREGQHITLEVSSSEPAYLTVVNMAADDKVYLLYPNQWQKELPIAAGKPLVLPRPDDGLDLLPHPLPGHPSDVEIIRIVATRQRVSPPPVEKDGTLSLPAFYRWLHAIPRADWVDAERKYTVFAARTPER